MSEFVNNFVTVANQVLVLFLLIAVGYICGKIKMINDTVSKGLGDLVMYFATPAVIISSFFRPFDAAMFKKLLLAFALALLFHGIAIAVSFLIRGKEESQWRVSRFGVAFSNAGYMSLPLQLALLGENGTFYGSSYVVIFNVVVWTYGLMLMGGKGQKMTAKKLVLNPGVISVVIGLIIFLCNIASYIPAPVNTALGGVAALNTPVPMFIIGYYLSKANLLSAFTDKRAYFPLFLRLLVCPALTLLVLWLLRVDYTITIAFIIASSAPMAAMTSIFSANFGRDTALSVKLVSLSTLLSIITMPAFVALAEFLYR